MSNLLLLLVCFVSGILLRRYNRIPSDASKVLNAFILYLSLPALVFHQIYKVKLSPEILLPALMPWLVFAFAFLLFYFLYSIHVYSKEMMVCLTLCCGLGNTSFVGIPILESYLGRDALAYGIICDQLGTFLVLSFPGVILIQLQGEKSWTFLSLCKRIFLFPPAIALLFAILFKSLSIPTFILSSLERLGDTLSPLALVSVGSILDFKSIPGFRKMLALGLVFKLLLSPLLIWIIYQNLNLSKLEFQTIVLESAMGPMVTSSILLIDRKIFPDLASLFLGVGIPISFLSTYCIYYLLSKGIL
ncbi:AEC family transporter [Leptospira ryugenii]|uniref:AEC family transporter n=1 Tax=Leptospira ryugenii TaxID=1917863 RepID=UPI000D595708|nr:AEC family transporter [Leptospira ryugenii]